MLYRTRSWLLLLLILTVCLAGCAAPAVVPPVEEPPVEEPPVVEPVEPPPPALPGLLIASIENHPSARPQSGLGSADLVFEMDCEAGITRFLALFASRPVEKIGPIRSVRTYFAQIVKAYNAPFAHAGGSTDGLNLTAELKLKDLDEIYNAGAAFFRSKDRKMPHNLYTSTDLLISMSAKKGYNLPAYTPLPVGEISGGQDAPYINLVYANTKAYKYATSYLWDGQVYAKSYNGQPFLGDDGEQLTAVNLIVLVAKSEWRGDKNPPTTDIHIVGSGAAFYFLGGKVYRGEWSKASPAAHFRFTSEGQEMRFAEGNTWINVIPGTDRLEYGAVPAPPAQ